MSTKDTRPGGSYLELMVGMRDEIAGFARHLGIPTARSLTIRYKTRVDGQTIDNCLRVDPSPVIRRIPPNIIAAFNNSNQVTYKADDLLVEGISRKYPRERIVGTSLSYFIDAETDGGFECELVSIDELPLTWNLVLRRRTDDRRNV